MMIFIINGLFAFLLLLLFDVFSMKEKNIVKYVCGLGGVFVLFVNSIALIQMDRPSFSLTGMELIGGILSPIFFVLIIYSIFIEVGKNTYEYNNQPKLITTGTYALSRHPGVLWLLLFFVSLSMFFNNGYLLIAGVIWSCVNIIYVTIQERFIFTKIFEDYQQYAASTPMLVPNIKSFKRFITNIRWRKK